METTPKHEEREMKPSAECWSPAAALLLCLHRTSTGQDAAELQTQGEQSKHAQGEHKRQSKDEFRGCAAWPTGCCVKQSRRLEVKHAAKRRERTAETERDVRHGICTVGVIQAPVGRCGTIYIEPASQATNILREGQPGVAN